MGKPPFLRENHGKTMGKPWESHGNHHFYCKNHGKTMGKEQFLLGTPWENHGKRTIFIGKTMGKPREHGSLPSGKCLHNYGKIHHF